MIKRTKSIDLDAKEEQTNPRIVESANSNISNYFETQRKLSLLHSRKLPESFMVNPMTVYMNHNNAATVFMILIKELIIVQFK